MKFIIGLLFLSSLAFATAKSTTTNTTDSIEAETKEEQEEFQEWSEEEEEARERAERERWLLEERARGYEPTSEDYRPVMPKKRITP